MTSANYRPAGQKLWDSWFVDDATGRHHVFYLQADENLDPDDRHDKAVVGHAVSDDYVHWTEIGIALKPGNDGAWDDLAIWTGSMIVDHDGLWHFYYTGRSRRDPLRQQIGHAVSEDLIRWRKLTLDQPVLSPQPPYDDRMELNERGTFPAFRDPFVFYNDESAQYEMLFTARTVGDELFNGCIGRAVSDNLYDWTVMDPLLAPGHYDEMECPQLIKHMNTYYLLFSAWPKQYEPDWAAQVATTPTGLHAYQADSLDSVFMPIHGTGIVQLDDTSLYAVRILPSVAGSIKLKAIGWINDTGHESFVGRLSQPFTLLLE